MIDPEEITFQNDPETEEFEAIVGKYRGFIQYRSNREGKIFLVHTEVAPELKGKDIAPQLVEYAFGFIREKGWKIIPMCPYIKAYLKKHPEHMDLVDSGIRLK